MAQLKTTTVKVVQDGVEKEVTVALVGPGGNPLYEIDGKDVEQDIVELRSILKASNDENAARRNENKELKEKLGVYGDLDPEKAKEALQTVANLDAKQLLDAKQVETMKAQWEATFIQNKAASDAAFEAKITELNGDLDAERARIKKMLVQRVFTDSKFLEGTTFDKLRDAAYMMFGERFVVEQGDNGDYRVVAKNVDGTQILSVARPGQPATMDEAMEVIINSHPQKDYILKGSQAGGSGAHGGAGGGAKGTRVQLQAAYDAAVKNGDTQAIISLRRQIHEFDQAAARGGA